MEQNTWAGLEKILNELSDNGNKIAFFKLGEHWSVDLSPTEDALWNELIRGINHFLTGKDDVSGVLAEKLKSEYKITKRSPTTV